MRSLDRRISLFHSLKSLALVFVHIILPLHQRPGPYQEHSTIPFCVRTKGVRESFHQNGLLAALVVDVQLPPSDEWAAVAKAALTDLTPELRAAVPAFLPTCGEMVQERDPICCCLSWSLQDRKGNSLHQDTCVMSAAFRQSGFY